MLNLLFSIKVMLLESVLEEYEMFITDSRTAAQVMSLLDLSSE